MPTDAHAITPMNRSLRRRRPTSQLMTAPASGAKIITLRRSLFPTKLCALVLGTSYLVLCTLMSKADCVLRSKYEERSSKPQSTRLIHIQRFAITKDGNDDSQTY